MGFEAVSWFGVRVHEVKEVIVVWFLSSSGADPIGSMSSMEVNVDLLEQMDLTDVSDHEALDVFLSSVGEESGALSPDTGRLCF